MFDFFMDIDNYEDRKVARYTADGLMVDTAAVSDGKHPYETAVEHPEYNDGAMVIVEAYDTKEEAQTGHDKWVKIMTGDLPPSLTDCMNALITDWLDASDMTFPRKAE